MLCRYAAATTCQYEALKYVSFPVQTLGKCAKMIPVMIWGYAINGRGQQRSFHKYARNNTPPYTIIHTALHL